MPNHMRRIRLARQAGARIPSRTLARLVYSRPWKALTLAMASMPLLQATGCFPDPLGALNFNLQTLLNGAIINAINIIVQNVLHL